MNKTKQEIKANMYQVSYAWIDKGTGVRCAWCNKLQSEIKDPVDHIEAHDFAEKELSSELKRQKKEMVNRVEKLMSKKRAKQLNELEK